MLKFLLSQFLKKNGRNPNNLEMILLKQKAAKEAIDQRKIVSMSDRSPVDPNKPILGGRNIEETEDQIKQRIINQNKESIERLKNKKNPEEFAYGGVAGLLGERTGFAGGGMGRRGFLKLLAGAGAGIGALKSGIFGLGKKTAVKKVAKELATPGGPPPYFFKLVEKITKLGDDAPRLAVKDREKVTTYKDYTLTEDITTGEKTIQRMKIDDDLKYDASEYYGKPVGEETYMSYKPGKGQADEMTKGKTPPDEYTEDTSLIRSDRPAEGEIMDTFDGVPEDVIEEAMEETIKIGKADGGRIGYAAGKGVTSLLNLVKKKFGRDSITTADKIKTPQKTLDRDMFKKFDDRNPDPKRQMTSDELEDFEMEIGPDQLEGYDFDGTVGDAQRILKEDKAYEAEMYQQYKMGKLDPEAGDKSSARKRFLEQKLADMEASGDSRLMTREEIEELTFFDLGTEMDNAKLSVNDEIKQGVAEIMSDTSPAALQKSIEIDNLMLKYPGMDKNLAEQIATEINPRKKADIIAMVEQTFKMSEKGMSGDDIIQTFKNTTRTKQATGGRIGYNAGSRVLQGILKLLKPKAKKSYLEKFPRVDIKELMKGEKPIKLYSGVGDREVNTLKAYRERAKDFGVTPEIVAKDNYKGQWFTPFKEYASSFGNARNIKSKMLTTELTPKEIKLAKRYVDKINKTNYLAHPHLPTKKSRYPVTTSDNTVLIPKIKLKKLKKEGKIDTDYMIKEKIKSKLGLAEGGLAAMLGE